MIRDELSRKISAALARLVAEGGLPEADYGSPEIADTKNPEHGDFACNIALTAAKRAGIAPREFGERLMAALASEQGFNCELAGPGFLNIRLAPAAISAYVPRILAIGDGLARSKPEHPLKLNIEYVSVNPNGPITVGSGRGAAFGSCLASVLEAAGHQVHREYYINDGVNSEQMRLFAESVKYYCERAAQIEAMFPDRGYKGDYVERVAEEAEESIEEWQEALDAMLKDWEAEKEKVQLELVDGREDAETVAAVAEEIARLKHLIDVAERAKESARSIIRALPVEGDIAVQTYQLVAQKLMLRSQRADLEVFGVQFDTWFSEQSLHDRMLVDECIESLVEKGLADEEPVRTVLKLGKGGTIEEVVKEEQPSDLEFGDDTVQQVRPVKERNVTAPTLWLRSTKFRDDMDRVLRRNDGRLTYIASDVAYHQDKLTDGTRTRGTGPVDKMITILGPDHHGYIGRLTAVVAALLERPAEPVGAGVSGSILGERIPGIEGGPLSEIEELIYLSPEEREACLEALEEARRRLEVVIFQIVRFMKDGKPAPMRKRDGNIYALIDLIDELGKTMAPQADLDEQRRIGRDVARFFYLMRSHETHMDFDIDLATRQSDENPVFYVQYAHARICSVIERAREVGLEVDTGADFALLTDVREMSLIKKVLDLPFEVRRCAEDYGVHRLTTYAVELARAYHHFYDACRVIQLEQRELSLARLGLCEAARVGLRGVFAILGISAPERMARVEPE